MAILGLAVIVFLVISIIRVNEKKAILNDSDNELFYKYRGMIENKQKRPETMSELEQSIWLLAQKDKENQSNKNSWITCLVICIIGTILIFFFIIYESF